MKAAIVVWKKFDLLLKILCFQSFFIFIKTRIDCISFYFNIILNTYLILIAECATSFSSTITNAVISFSLLHLISMITSRGWSANYNTIVSTTCKSPSRSFFRGVVYIVQIFRHTKICPYLASFLRNLFHFSK